MRKNTIFKRGKALLLLLVFMASFFSMPIAAEEEAAVAVNAKFTDVTLTIDDKVIGDDNTDLLQQEGAARLSYDFTISDSREIVADTNDTIETQVPLGFLIASNVVGDVIGTKANGDQAVIGKFTLTKDTRELSIKFNDEIHSGEPDSIEWNGQVFLNTEFQLEELPNTDNPAEFSFIVNSELTKVLNLNFVPGGIAGAISKSGKMYQDDKEVTTNPSSILWTVSVNTDLKTIDAIVEDTLAEGLVLTGDSSNNYNVKVYEADVDLNGVPTKKVDPYNTEDYSVTYDEATRKLVVDFEEDITSAYIIEFETTIDSDHWNQLSFDNTAILKDISTADATVGFTRGEQLIKKGQADRAYNPTSIDWTIDVNKYGQQLSKGSVSDTIPEGLTLVADSLVYSTIELKADGTIEATTPGASIVLETSDRDLTFKLPEETNGAYRIFYTTTIDNPNNTTYTNTAILNDKNAEDVDVKLSEAYDSVEANYGSLLTKTALANIGYGANNHKIDWTIDINLMESLITGGVMTDVIPNGLTLEDLATIEINKLSIDAEGNKTVGAALTHDTALSYDDDDETAESKRTLKLLLDKLSLENKDKLGTEAFDYAIRLKYTTTIDDEEDRGPFDNRAQLTGTTQFGTGSGTGIGVGGAITDNQTGNEIPGLEVVFSPIVAFNNNVDKKFVAIDYSAKTITWKINVKPIKEAMDNLVLTDTFTYDGLTFLPESLTVTDDIATVDDLSFVESDMDENDVIDYGDGFVLTFPNSVPSVKTYTVEYKTSFDRLTHDDTTNLENYENTVDASWNEADDPDLKVDVNNSAMATLSTVGINNGRKSGSAVDRATKTIEWTIDANYLSETTDTYTIADTIPDDNPAEGNTHYHQKMMPETFKVYKYSLAANGDLSDNGDEIVQGSDAGDYTVVSMTDTGFEIIINGSVDYPVRVIYKTLLINEAAATYSNTALLNGDKSVSASVTHSDYDAFASKAFVYTSSQAKIDWRVEINESLSTINHGVMVDTLSPGLEFDKDSIKVYKQPGDILIDPLVEPAVYTAKVEVIDTASSQEQLTLVFEDLIEDQYTVEYTTYVTVATNQTVNNSVSFKGDGVVAYNDTDDKEQAIAVTTGYAAALAKREQENPKGTLTIAKVDKADTTIKLSDVVFKLYDSEMNFIATLDATDDNGETTINRLPYGTYYLEETVAPAGYQIPTPNKLEIVTNKAVEHYTVSNDKSKGTSDSVEDTKDPDPEVGEDPDPEVSEEPDTTVKEDTKTNEEAVTEKDKPIDGTVEVPQGSVIEKGEEPDNGTVEVDDKGKWTYTPDPDYVGEDQFSIIVKKPDGDEEFLIDILVEEIPEGIIELPQTGGMPLGLLLGLSSLFIGFGTLLRRKEF